MMEYIASIAVPDKEARKLFASKDFSSERVSVEMGPAKDGFVFHIKAKDSVALRAVCNSITKLLTVHEKMTKV